MGSIDPRSYRILSDRRKKRRIKDGFRKNLLQIDREVTEIDLKIRNLGYEPLDPPIQQGWKRIFVLREDVRRSTKGEFFEAMLKIINTNAYSHRKDFKVKRRKFGRKIYVERDQKLKSLSECEWNKLKLDIHQVKFFDKREEYDYKGNVSIKCVFNEPWRFVLKIEPNMITHVRIRDWELEQRSSEIHHYLKSNDLYRKVLKAKCGYVKWRWKNSKELKYKSPYSGMTLIAILFDIYDDYHSEVCIK